MLREVRQIYSEKVRLLCIKDGLYTCGTNKDYSNLLLNLCDCKNVSLGKIKEIAEDILNHSNVEEKLIQYDCSYDDFLTHVMTNLINECCFSFVSYM